MSIPLSEQQIKALGKEKEVIVTSVKGSTVYASVGEVTLKLKVEGDVLSSLSMGVKLSVKGTDLVLAKAPKPSNKSNPPLSKVAHLYP